MKGPRILKKFRDNQRGAISIEFGILVSVLVAILFGAVEYSRYMLTQSKAEKSVAAVGDMVSQYTQITSDNVKDIFQAAAQILTHYNFEGKGLLIVSHIHAAQKNNPKITWQEFSSDSFAATSKLGKVGETPKLPAGFTMDAGESVVAVESFVKFEPMLFDLSVSNKDVYKISWFKPRKADQIAYTKTGSASVATKNCGNIKVGAQVGNGGGLMVCVGK